ncbi:hypothetical protein NC00_17195 [Xanthomonas cannabis pv. phaseoli]|uniref:Uncharacterized protein n=1 Tax=Xanthomonas cannabis pv. phaseoli TaxID=1885902 RepID=A0AB34P4S6_9XANT|nr:hypothetical protein NC00_17195 [Xanthomonas cannabis pv. phaseoli]
MIARALRVAACSHTTHGAPRTQPVRPPIKCGCNTVASKRQLAMQGARRAALYAWSMPHRAPAAPA